MPSQADRIRSMLEHTVEVTGQKAVQAVADEIETALHELTPKQTGKTAASWTQEKQDNGDIHIVTRLKTKKGEQPARYLIELNEGTATTPPTKIYRGQHCAGAGKGKVTDPPAAVGPGRLANFYVHIWTSPVYHSVVNRGDARM